MNIRKKNYEELYMKIKQKCREYHIDLEQAKYIIENYNKFLYELNDQLMLQSERNLEKREMDEITININEKEAFEFIENQIDKISLGFSRLNDWYLCLKDNFG